MQTLGDGSGIDKVAGAQPACDVLIDPLHLDGVLDAHTGDRTKKEVVGRVRFTRLLWDS